jgi:hypothetical protein
MGNLQFVDCSNVGGFLGSSIPFQNALGIENWPHSVQDEHRRVSENDKDREFIPIEELLVADLDGRPWLSDDRDNDQDQEELLLHDDYQEVRGEKAEAICQNENAGDDEDRLDTPEKCRDYYRAMYPWLFLENAPSVDQPAMVVRPSFHGRTRQNITPKTELRAKPNSKKRRIKYLSMRRDMIRTAYF